MSDKGEKLRATLGELHRELENMERVDPEVRSLLEGAVEDIHARLEGTPKESEVPIAGRLADAASHFEGSHPTLAALIENTIDLLARMGI